MCSVVVLQQPPTTEAPFLSTGQQNLYIDLVLLVDGYDNAIHQNH